MVYKSVKHLRDTIFGRKNFLLILDMILVWVDIEFVRLGNKGGGRGVGVKIFHSLQQLMKLCISKCKPLSKTYK